MIQSTVEHRRDAVARLVLRLLVGIDAAAVHADADRAVVVAGDIDEIAHFFLPRLGALVVIQVARVVAELIDMRCESLGQPVVFLQIDDQIGRRLAANLGDGFGLGRTVDGDSHHVGARGGQRVHLPDRRIDVARCRGGHALHGDRVAGADRNRADAD